MTWEEVGQICFNQVPLVAKHLPVAYWNGEWDWQKRVHMLFTDEERLKPKIDDLIIRFCRSRTLRAIPAGILNFLVSCRFLCASDTVNIVLAGDEVHRVVRDPEDVADEEVLSWLLIKTWNEWRWDSFLKLEALRSLGGEDSFYGRPRLPTYTN
jgi:hypothetical protein